MKRLCTSTNEIQLALLLCVTKMVNLIWFWHNRRVHNIQMCTILMQMRLIHGFRAVDDEYTEQRQRSPMIIQANNACVYACRDTAVSICATKSTIHNMSHGDGSFCCCCCCCDDNNNSNETRYHSHVCIGGNWWKLYFISNNVTFLFGCR